MPGNRNQRKLMIVGWSLHGAGLVIAAGIIAAAVLLLFAPLHLQRSELKEQLTETSRVLSEAARVKSENEELTRHHSREQAKLTQLMSRLPDSPRESDFLAELTGLAQQTEFTIRDYRPRVAQEEEDYHFLDIALSAEATYASLCGFLNGLTSLSRVSRITDLEVSNRTETTTVYAIEMSIRIYFSPLSQSASDNAWSPAHG